MSESHEAKIDSAPKSTARRDQLLSIERAVQQQWSAQRLFEADAGALPRPAASKYFATFPYPYMNGALHLGHAFTLAKVDYQCHYQRLKGRQVLFPFAFHCTGMPIAASADKVRREMAAFGDPPCFPADDDDEAAADDDEQRQHEGGKAGEGQSDEARAAARRELEHERQEHKEGLAAADSAAAVKASKQMTPEELEQMAATSATQAVAEEAIHKADKRRKKGKAKLAKKSSKKTYQWDILKEMGVPEDQLALFADPYHWLSYFVPLAVADLKSFGLCADWRRSFITTHVNPYYDAFIRWQFNTLRKREKIEFGARLSIFSPIDNQTCADHDRAEGEGVGMTDYTLVKIQLLQPYPAAITALLAKLSATTTTSPSRPQPAVYLPAATLRPETMYGQTNVFLLPEGEYGVYDVDDATVFVCSAKSALNMAYQNVMRERGKVHLLGTIKGQELMGLPVKAPLCSYERVYVLPLTTIKMDKGTGVVTSVPSDAPDDYAALMDLKRKPAWREKFGIADHAVLPFEVVPIIDIPGLGSQAAVDLCIAEKVASQNDRAKLDLIKDRTYKEGFAKGVMLVGEYAGMKVSEAKPAIKNDLIAAGLAVAYSEPEARVVSRSGNECVVAYSDQWYLKYGEEAWAAQVKHHIETRLECYNPIAKKDFLWVVGWLHHWACSRSYGLGTFLPWDPQYVIESLSDSTIYMAYYTIAHLLQGGVQHNNIEGSTTGPARITPDQLTDDVFDYIFLKDQPAPASTAIPHDTLQQLKREFEYWYPLDLRVSGKDLIGNHLTFSLYSHAAVWDDDASKWPQSFFTNGHVTIDAKKMSKSDGTFITMKDAISEYSADATRFALADAGDGLEDANFEKKSVNAAILKLTKEIEWVEEVVADIKQQQLAGQAGQDTTEVGKLLRRGELSFLDRVFLNELNGSVVDADRYYSMLQFRFALKAAFHDLLSLRDAYRVNVGRMHVDVVSRFLEVSVLLIAPICPHYAQHLWILSGLDSKHNYPFVATARWPTAEAVDQVLARQMSYLRDVNAALRKSYVEQLAKLTKSKAKALKGQSVQKAAAAADTSSVSHLLLITAATYPAWQRTILHTLSQLYGLSKPSPPPRKAVIDAIKFQYAAQPDAAAKKQMEAATKFAGGVLDELAGGRGEAALEEETPFEERELCAGQLGLLLREVPVDEACVRVVSDEEAQTLQVEGAQAAASKALPGKPAFLFYGQA